MAAEMREPSNEFENLFLGAESGRGILFFDDFADGTPARGRRLTDIAADRNMDPVDALLDIVAVEPGQVVVHPVPQRGAVVLQFVIAVVGGLFLE